MNRKIHIYRINWKRTKQIRYPNLYINENYENHRQSVNNILSHHGSDTMLKNDKNSNTQIHNFNTFLIDKKPVRYTWHIQFNPHYKYLTLLSITKYT